MSEPMGVTELYRDLCKHVFMNREIPSRTVGEIAAHIYALGYRKRPDLRVITNEANR